MNAHTALTETGEPVPRRIAEDVGDRSLARAALLFSIAVIIHNGDHWRRGAEKLSADVFWVGGPVGIAVEVAVVVLICQRHRLAPLAASVVGVGLAAGYIEVHFLPAHRWLSDSYTSAADISPLSWTAASLEVVAALVLTAVGLTVLRRRGGVASAARPHPAQRRLMDALRDPLALVVILSQIVMLTVFFVQAYG
jgi:hypothetical protein